MFECSDGGLSAAEVGTRLGLGDDFTPWLEELAIIGPPASPARLPARHERGDLLARLGVEAADATEIIQNWPRPSPAPEWEWLLQRCYQQLVAHMEKPYSAERLLWKPLPPHLGTFGRLFYVYVFLAALPVTRQWHRGRGISDELSWATLTDLGEHLAIHRRRFGSCGLGAPYWPVLHFSGKLYRLGRLQFERWRISARWSIHSADSSDHALPSTPPPGEPALSVHIPESGGSLEPAACSTSFAWARSFFACHFPEKTYCFARCDSWLLDPQLANYLPATSNIISFQRRFHLVPGGFDDDESVMSFIFWRVAPSLDELPQRTTLERAIVAHLRAGGHWRVRSGWLEL